MQDTDKEIEQAFLAQVEPLRIWFCSEMAALKVENSELKKQLAEGLGTNGVQVPKQQRLAEVVPDVNPVQTPGSPPTVSVPVNSGKGHLVVNDPDVSFDLVNVAHRPHLRDVWKADAKANSQANARNQKVGELLDRFRQGEPEDEYEEEPGSKKCRLTCTLPMHPNNPARVAWDVLAAACLFCDFITIPLGVFKMKSNILSTLSYCILGYWTADMVVGCNTGYITPKGEYISSYTKILKRYAMTWMLLDILIVGSEWIMLLFNDNSRSATTAGPAAFGRIAKAFRAARIVRMLRLLRLAKLRELVCRVEEMIDSEYVSIIWNVCCNIFVLLMLNHLCACFWFFVGSSEREDTWVKYYELTGSPVADKYFISLHWSLTQFTPASMMVQPQNLSERIFAVCVLLMALVMFSTFVSSVTAGMTRLRNLQAEHVADQYRLRKFLKVNQISPDLVARVNRYIEIAMHTRKKTVPRQSVRLLKYLSGPLNIELLMEMYVPHLKVHPFFEHYLCASVLGHLCYMAIDMSSAAKGDEVFHRYRKATHFYLLHAGSTFYKVRGFGRRAKTSVLVPQGSWFTEAVLWVHWYHQGTMQALTECDMMTICASKFMEVIQSQIVVVQQTRAYAQEFVQDMNDSIDIHGRAWDVPMQLMKAASQLAMPKNDSVSEIMKAENMEAQLQGLDESDQEEEAEGSNLQVQQEELVIQTTEAGQAVDGMSGELRHL